MLLILLPLLMAQTLPSKVIYPCSKCHSVIHVTGLTHKSPYHGIDLTKGAHRGLYCVDCHNPQDQMMTLKGLEGKIPMVIKAFASAQDKMRMNMVCASCHFRTYQDYIHLAHGNKTFECAGGSIILIKGYKGVPYNFHVCNEYIDLKTKPAKACIDCHDPHDPQFKAPHPMPLPSERPLPPEQNSILKGLIFASAAAIAFFIIAWVIRR